jgi:hypothetical protein
MTMLSNPRLAVFGLIMPILLAAGISVFFLMGPVYGVVATGIAAFVDWTMLKILRRQLRTTVTVDGEGARFDLYGEERIDIPWPEATLVGLAAVEGKRGRRARQLFFYAEGVDRLMVVPGEFARFPDFVEETRRCSPTFRDIALAAGETLKERLRSLVVTAPGTTPRPIAGSPAEPPAGGANDPATGAPGRN